MPFSTLLYICLWLLTIFMTQVMDICCSESGKEMELFFLSSFLVFLPRIMSRLLGSARLQLLRCECFQRPRVVLPLHLPVACLGLSILPFVTFWLALSPFSPQLSPPSCFHRSCSFKIHISVSSSSLSSTSDSAGVRGGGSGRPSPSD